MRRLLRAQWAPLLAATVVAGIVLGLVTRHFGTAFNIYTILQTAAIYAAIGLSQMVVLAVADMSLAVGGIAGLVTIAVGGLYDAQHWPIGAAIAAGVGLGLACGLVNGLIIVLMDLSGFIVTLATGFYWLLIPLAYGFWARVLTGPTLSPLGWTAQNVIAPRLGPKKPVPGPPKRFAQGMGAAMATLALIFWLALGTIVVRWYDRRGLQRLSPDLIDYVQRSIAAYRAQPPQPQPAEKRARVGGADRTRGEPS